MDKNAAETEMLYRLCKLVLVNMVNDGCITAEEANEVCRAVRSNLNPIVGCLDEVIRHD